MTHAKAIVLHTVLALVNASVVIDMMMTVNVVNAAVVVTVNATRTVNAIRTGPLLTATKTGTANVIENVAGMATETGTGTVIGIANGTDGIGTVVETATAIGNVTETVKTDAGNVKMKMETPNALNANDQMKSQLLLGMTLWTNLVTGIGRNHVVVVAAPHSHSCLL